MSKPKIVALVPMKHHSERVPEKNYRDFNGKPLFHWVIESLLKCSSIDAIYINTDSPIIKSQAPLLSGRVHIIDRPENLCGDKTPMNDILLYDVDQIQADYFIQTHSTNPFLQAKTIDNAISTFLQEESYDSLFSVTRLHTRLWDAQGQPINHDPNVLLRTQDLPPIFEENSNIYIFKPDVLRERKNRIGHKPLMFEISFKEAIDIDEESDFMISETLSKLETKKV